MNCAICMRKSATKYCPKCELHAEEFETIEKAFVKTEAIAAKMYPEMMNAGLNWILSDKGEPIPANFAQWTLWMTYREHERQIALDVIGEASISTIFLGVSLAVCSTPMLWETMVFGGALDHEQTRCGGSREQAEAMHVKMCRRVAKLEKAKI